MTKILNIVGALLVGVALVGCGAMPEVRPYGQGVTRERVVVGGSRGEMRPTESRTMACASGYVSVEAVNNTAYTMETTATVHGRGGGFATTLRPAASQNWCFRLPFSYDLYSATWTVAVKFIPPNGSGLRQVNREYQVYVGRGASSASIRAEISEYDLQSLGRGATAPAGGSHTSGGQSSGGGTVKWDELRARDATRFPQR